MECKYQELSKAQSIDEIVQVTCDYLASWSSEELGRLPDSCRPGWVKGPEDIERWADRLTDESGKAVLFLDDERKLDRLTSHFLIASVRIRQLALRPALKALAA
ncbi:MAG TPA: hypothetical protein VFK48_02965 [Usitatibacter sp.]|nr:hypothetical protein [Usitatibacter sp.]